MIRRACPRLAVAVALLGPAPQVGAQVAVEAPGQQRRQGPPPAPASGGPAPTPEPSRVGATLAEALRAGTEVLTADRAAALAVQSAPSLERARAANDKAREAAAQAWLGVYPRLDLEARYTRLSAQDPVPLPFELPPIPGMESQASGLPAPLVDQYALRAQLAYPVSDLFLRVLPRHEAAQGFAKAQELNGVAEQRAVELQAREAFYNYARAKASRWVAQTGLHQSQAQRADVAASVAAGALAKVELMRADALVAASQVALARAQGSVAVAQTALQTLLHRPSGAELAVTEDLEQALPPPRQSLEALLEQARQRRSELRAMRLMAGAHEQARDAEQAGALPRLSISGVADYANPNPRIAFQAEPAWNATWSAMAVLSWSPNDWAAATKGAGQAQADAMQARADLHALEDALRVEVTRAYEDYRAAVAAMGAASAGIAAAEESYRVRRQQFRAGAAVSTEVVDAEVELRRARLDLVNAAIDARIAQARLNRAVERSGE